MSKQSDDDVRWGRGGEPHARIPEWILLSGISDKAVRLYCMLSRYADSEGKAFPGKKALMEKLSCSRTTIDNAFKELVRSAAIVVEPRWRDDGSRSTNQYILNWVQEHPTSPSDRRVPSPGGRRVQEERMPEGTIERTLKRVTLAGWAEIELKDGKQNEPFNTLQEVCGIDKESRVNMNLVGTALNGKGPGTGIVDLYWIEATRYAEEHGLMDELAAIRDDPVRLSDALCVAIRRKATRYREQMKDAMLTPTALAKWWLDLEMGREDHGDRLRRLVAEMENE